MAGSDNKKLLSALEGNWQTEMQGFHTYAALSASEADAHHRNALRGLAMAEKHHADLWAGRIKQLGGQEPQYTGKPDGQAGSLANRVGGSDLALRRLEIDEGRDIAKYGEQLKALGDQPSIAILEEVIADEREHYLTLGNLIRSRGALPALPSEQAQAALDDLVAARNKGHAQAAGWVGDAIYGINDGLGSIFGIVSGVSGATLGNSHFRFDRWHGRHGCERIVDGFRRLSRGKKSERSTKLSSPGKRKLSRIMRPKRVRFCRSVIKFEAFQKKTRSASLNTLRKIKISSLKRLRGSG